MILEVEEPLILCAFFLAKGSLSCFECPPIYERQISVKHGSSSRNSGYLVDTTLNDGFTSNKDLIGYKKKTDIYELGIKVIKKFIQEYQVDCDWNESGKFFASSKTKDEKILNNFSNTLSKLGFEHNFLDNEELSKRLGTSFYNVALYTQGGVLLHPGKLVRAMIDVLPKNVQLLENS